MNRLLLTIRDAKCPFGCRYCFARFSQYRRPTSLDEVEAAPDQLDDVDVIYPACDVDFFALADAEQLLWRLVSLRRSISISTKAELSPRSIASIRAAQTELASYNAILKVSVSVSTKYSTRQIEPGTAPYGARVDNMRALASNMIPCSLTLKPILVDIPPSEYVEILADMASHSRVFLLGDEYVDSPPHEPRVALNTSGALEERCVDWIPSSLVWPVRRSPNHMLVIREAASRLGGACFDSDLDVMRFLHSQANGKKSDQRQHPELVLCP